MQNRFADCAAAWVRCEGVDVRQLLRQPLRKKQAERQTSARCATAATHCPAVDD